MSDLISRKALKHDIACDTVIEPEIKEYLLRMIDGMETAFDAEYELRLLKNYLHNKPKIYRQRNQNFMIVRDLLMSGTTTAGMTSCIMKCHKLGIDPYGYSLESEV